MGYKYIKLTSEEVLTLEQAVKNHSKSHFRTRCESVLLSNRGYDIKSIALLYQIRINTIGTWFSNWTNKGIVGLQIVSGRGRKADLSTACDALIQDIKEHIALNPQGLEAVCLQINEKWGLNLSKQQVKKFIKKKLGYRWRRFRKCIKKCQDPEKYQSLVNELCQLLQLEKQGYLRIYYGDESGFSLDPSIPYGWQPKEQYIKIVPKKSQRLNVFGLLSKENDIQAYSSTDTMNSDLVIAFIDDFAKKNTQRTVIVLDNAPIHHSEAFKDKIDEWDQMDLHIFFLPTYSPHLNLIETLWRKIKYEWLKPQDYLDFDTLTNAVENIILDVGQKYKINFGELKYFTNSKLSII